MRSYKEYCGVAMALDLVGQRWTLLLVRDLLPGPRRFRDLTLPGLTPNVLADRLRHLAEKGLVEKVILPPPASCQAWSLTAAGRRLEPVILALGAFGATAMEDPEGYTVRLRWLMVSLMRRYGGGLDGVIDVRTPEGDYTLELTADGLVARDGRAVRPDAVISGEKAEVAALLGRRRRDADVRVDGDQALVEALVDSLGR